MPGEKFVNVILDGKGEGVATCAIPNLRGEFHEGIGTHVRWASRKG
jgi:hypothetical protein